ncbi:MAG: hypothetical protein COV10_02655 [Candidatus Vogelbacteria bacterium CG10_big_fil_rev_8_21_14_0_10_51_16]|uniref:ABC transporter domain-containing protein n=1 Tax=Candidatus Vogelbacteria bacterium CG10_big_fil_rev_8_21_14_0_10_51_16 TaxID=1975045 RepID=A0A2H0RE93_9BACT|nr:MAG: hypothetical protein COV10_02655 [Candidatus Vogelbacteria bacterium CG10_big_fil_rev_8_21_14_0_10_51_16]
MSGLFRRKETEGKRRRRENALLYLTRIMWHYSAGNRRVVLFYTALFVLAMGVTLFVHPLIRAAMIAVVESYPELLTAEGLDSFTRLLLLVVGAHFLFSALHYPGRIMEQANEFRIWALFREQYLEGVLARPLAWHAEHHSAELADTIEKGSSAISDFSGENFQNVYALTKLVGVLGMLCWLFPVSAPIVVVMLMVSIAITMLCDRVIVPLYKQISRAENSVSKHALDTITNITTAIILRIESLLYYAIRASIWNVWEVVRPSIRWNEAKWFLASTCCVAMKVIVLWSYALARYDAKAGFVLAEFYLLMYYLDEMSELFYEFTSRYGTMLRRQARVYHAEDELAVAFGDEKLTNHVLPLDWREVMVKDLSFSYHGENSDQQLNDVAMRIGRGERIALVGPSGGGKTTVLKLLRGLYEAQGYELRVDGLSVPEGFAGIARAISLIPQNPEIFARSVGYNITLGVEHPPALIEQCIELACFVDVLSILPRGMESHVNERGMSLSGGQRQRLALARGLLASLDKSVVLLDEPTASLDKASVLRFYRGIFEAFADKAVIVSLHDLHLLHLFDTIYMLEGGRVVGVGTQEHLMATCLPFRRFLLEAEMAPKTSPAQPLCHHCGEPVDLPNSETSIGNAIAECRAHT